MGLETGKVLPKDMDAREFARWAREQRIEADEDTVSTNTIQDGAVTLAKLADLTADRIIGRLSTDGVPQALTAAQVATLIKASIEAYTSLEFAATSMGFFGATGVAQQSVSTYTVTTVSGTGNDAAINTNLNAIKTVLDSIETALTNLGLAT